MLQNQTLQTFPVLAATVIRKNRFVKMGTNGNVVECDTANEDALGISLRETKADETSPITVQLLSGGSVEVEAGAAIDTSTAKNVATDNQGRAVVATGAGTAILGIAQSDIDNAGEILTMLAIKGAGEV